METPLDSRSFRQTMGLFATGVTVVAAQTGDEIHAMTANSLTSVSLEPLLVLVCIHKQASIMAHLAPGVVFSINILRAEQQALSTYFARGWKEPTPPPFRFVPWRGGPRLEGCLAALCCEFERQLEGGDHWIVVGRVVALHQGVPPHEPLLFYSGRYGRLASGEPAPPPDTLGVEVPVHIFYDPWTGDEVD